MRTKGNFELRVAFFQASSERVLELVKQTEAGVPVDVDELTFSFSVHLQAVKELQAAERKVRDGSTAFELETLRAAPP